MASNNLPSDIKSPSSLDRLSAVSIRLREAILGSQPTHFDRQTLQDICQYLNALLKVVLGLPGTETELTDNHERYCAAKRYDTNHGSPNNALHRSWYDYEVAGFDAGYGRDKIQLDRVATASEMCCYITIMIAELLNELDQEGGAKLKDVDDERGKLKSIRRSARYFYEYGAREML